MAESRSSFWRRDVSRILRMLQYSHDSGSSRVKRASDEHGASSNTLSNISGHFLPTLRPSIRQHLTIVAP